MRQMPFLIAVVGTVVLYQLDPNGVLFYLAAINALANKTLSQLICGRGACRTPSQPSFWQDPASFLREDPVSFIYWGTGFLGGTLLLYGLLVIYA
ncbi:MAG: hypothetical protein HQL52_18495 [Magnetococcales bacterium]|nr:hypothetical protein [Magnetococcales bacterium]